jgi:DAACS family dicarboxylate/amino acid:cation (Na+ or H+) symporter
VTGDKKRIPFALKILVALILGILVGWFFGAKAAPLAKIGTVILDLIRGLAGPLLFFAIIDAFLRTTIKARSGALMVTISMINATIAIGIGLAISHILRPGDYLNLGAVTGAAQAAERFGTISKSVAPDRHIAFFQDLIALVPTSVVKPFVENAVLSIVFISVLGGLALRKVKSEQQARGDDSYWVMDRFFASGYRGVEILLGWVIELVPIAIFAVVAKTVGEYGFEPFKGLAVYVGVAILGMAIQVGVVYQLWLTLARMPLKRFWSGGSEAVLYAMGAASSLATLPVTLRCLERLKVSPQSARLSACVGTNLNNDGILLYEAMAVLFVAQACGIHLSVGEQILVAASCALAGIGISGIPEAGLISLLIVLRTVKTIPDEQVLQIVPLLLTVDWVLGRCRAMTNVTSDMVVAVVLDHFRKDDENGQREPAPHSLENARPVPFTN